MRFFRKIVPYQKWNWKKSLSFDFLIFDIFWGLSCSLGAAKIHFKSFFKILCSKSNASYLAVENSEVSISFLAFWHYLFNSKWPTLKYWGFHRNFKYLICESATDWKKYSRNLDMIPIVHHFFPLKHVLHSNYVLCTYCE